MPLTHAICSIYKVFWAFISSFSSWLSLKEINHQDLLSGQPLWSSYLTMPLNYTPNSSTLWSVDLSVWPGVPFQPCLSLLPLSWARHSFLSTLWCQLSRPVVTTSPSLFTTPSSSSPLPAQSFPFFRGSSQAFSFQGGSCRCLPEIKELFLKPLPTLSEPAFCVLVARVPYYKQLEGPFPFEFIFAFP